MHRLPFALWLAFLAGAAMPAMGDRDKGNLTPQQAQAREEALWPPPISQAEQGDLDVALRLCHRILGLRAELRPEDLVMQLHDVQNIFMEVLKTYQQCTAAINYFKLTTEYEIARQTRMLLPPGRSRNKQLALVAAQKKVLSRVLKNRDLTANALEDLRFRLCEVVREVAAPVMPELRAQAESDWALEQAVQAYERPVPRPAFRDPEQRNLPLSTAEKKAFANRVAEEQRSEQQFVRKLKEERRDEQGEEGGEGSEAEEARALRWQERMAARVQARARREAQRKLEIEQQQAAQSRRLTREETLAWEGEEARLEQARMVLEAEERLRQRALEAERRQYWSMLRRLRSEEEAAAAPRFGPASASALAPVLPASMASPGVVFRWHPEAQAELEQMDEADQQAVAQVVAKVEATTDGLKWKSSKALSNPQGLFELRPKGGLSPWRPLYMRMGRNVFLILTLARKEGFDHGVARAMARSGDLLQLDE